MLLRKKIYYVRINKRADLSVTVKGVLMQVSAINVNTSGYNMSNNIVNRYNEPIGDTSFNSLTPYSSKKTTSTERLPFVFDSVNQWKNFCHQ